MTIEKIKQIDNFVVSIVLVVQNSEKNIKERLQEIYSLTEKLITNYEIIIIDNGSTDNTIDIVKNEKLIMKRCRILVLSKNYQVETAISAGLDTCVGDFAIIFDLYANPVESIAQFLSYRLIKKSDLIIGQFSKPIFKENFIVTIIKKLIIRFSSHHTAYYDSYSIALSRKAINAFVRTRRKNRNLGYLDSLVGLSKGSVEFKPLVKYKRFIHKQSAIKQIINLLDISVSNSYRPIRAVWLLGIIASTGYLVYVFIIVVLALFFNHKTLLPQGWTTISTSLAIMFLLLFTLLAILSEYVLRILNESRDEPFYFIDEEINQSSILPEKGVLNIV